MKKIFLILILASVSHAASSSRKWSGELFGGYAILGAVGPMTHPAIVPIDDLANSEKGGGLAASFNLVLKNRYRFSGDWIASKLNGSEDPISSKVYLNHYELGLALNFGNPDKFKVFVGGIARLVNVKVEDYTQDGGLIASVGVDHKILLPMAQAGFDWTFMKVFSLVGTVKYFSGGGNTLSDYSGALQWRLIKAFSVTGGYRQIKFKYNKNSLDTDLTQSGPFVMAGFQF